jgi:hypothetical protein
MRSALVVATLAAATAGSVACGPKGGPNANCTRANPCIVTLASNQVSPLAIAVQGSDVYWTSDVPSTGAVVSAPTAGGAPTTLASNLNSPTVIAVDSSSVYWAENTTSGSVAKVGLSGGTPTTFASGQNTPSGLAVSGSKVFWSDYGANAVMEDATSGGSASLFQLTSAGPLAMAADATNVYWVAGSGSEGTLFQAPVGGGAPTPVTSVGLVNGIAVDATSLYFTDGSEVNKVPIGGGSPNPLASCLGADGVAVDSSNVYFACSSGDIIRVGVNGGVPVTLATRTGMNPRGLAIDANSVYWTEYSSLQVMQLTPK